VIPTDATPIPCAGSDDRAAPSIERPPIASSPTSSGQNRLEILLIAACSDADPPVTEDEATQLRRLQMTFHAGMPGTRRLHTGSLSQNDLLFIPRLLDLRPRERLSRSMIAIEAPGWRRDERRILLVRNRGPSDSSATSWRGEMRADSRWHPPASASAHFRLAGAHDLPCRQPSRDALLGRLRIKHLRVASAERLVADAIYAAA